MSFFIEFCLAIFLFKSLLSMHLAYRKFQAWINNTNNLSLSSSLLSWFFISLFFFSYPHWLPSFEFINLQLKIFRFVCKNSSFIKPLCSFHPTCNDWINHLPKKIITVDFIFAFARNPILLSLFDTKTGDDYFVYQDTWAFPYTEERSVVIVITSLNHVKNISFCFAIRRVLHQYT